MRLAECFMIGVDHNQTPIEIREKLAFKQEEALLAKKALVDAKLVNEVIILSTCNRTEFYIVSFLEPETIIQWWLSFKQVSGYENYIQIRYEYDALRHLIKTASGINSMVLGEPQILGQVRKSYLFSLENQYALSKLGRFFDQALIAAKAIRRGTAIGSCPVSVAFSAVNVAKKHYLESIKDKQVLILGAGQTAQLVARHIDQLKPKSLLIANRTLDKAKALTEYINAKAYQLSELDKLILKADIIISAVASDQYLVDETNIEKNNVDTKLIIDLSMPRSIKPSVSIHHHVTLYSVDNLNEMITENKQLRQKAIHYADKLVEQSLQQYKNNLRYREKAYKIKELRRKADDLASFELQKSIKKLDNGSDPYQVLSQLVHSLKNKWLHQPSTSMRQAMINGHDDMLDHVDELFGLNTNNNKP
ncbi:glutamyl-tRNA reductase [Thiotrichales bacterium 19S11-10]|nr:glutamyl-tRNA reductase [Thiotrichales bacterium 19S11-10]MCF6806934.1 glutamyl-tRNA reductase [Thiotrichales bacterium 19S9-11]MCF6810903.1 glutamyl-tRNA reductase [Thiotrichales bacterium 19S9-12]